MTRRRVERLEDRAGTGRAAWYVMAADGQRAALEAVRRHGGDTGQGEAVRRVFLAFHEAYRPGMGEADRMEAADLALDRLHDALPRDVYALTLAFLRYGLP